MTEKEIASARNELTCEFKSEIRNKSGFSDTGKQLHALCESVILKTHNKRSKNIGLQEKTTMRSESVEESANHVLKITEDIGADQKRQVI